MFTIRTDLPMPKIPNERSRSKYPFTEMTKGSCFEIFPEDFVDKLDAEAMQKRVQNTCKEYNRRKGCKFFAEVAFADVASAHTTTKVKIVRVWCVDPVPQEVSAPDEPASQKPSDPAEAPSDENAQN